ncbi:lipopolysaccharide biosynthesis protein [Bradyrhizobium sp. WBOS7]|uniref:Lipopolysaccharide biosynthesis protein n=1 Tax=Bradyrhizobium betae TaxID=244734 RepID=A0AAE9ST04_9BRAD|nr:MULTISPECIES: exopolysaccharide transport family protein [Bradyrhizobium]MDD1572711.1 lipopolysaccharide biosynthesis protein [Bradyrhizobium sp. WBOS1]UUO33558.1 lipopolysaccharide biosynthesis protein [Bradyrhizobium sp. WBOS01]MDD1528050.1 lipopolysaccharide biosynthesis protein [Bradyrhizobium sp. WBOS2]MDD1578630.1 lipopolysaccharide biosynthesis protein [Bradyrhizobium sp. WBOS7]MDD1603192.1 lipopolysaccharide biosynthesis protein [Bradyrhizobium sp. WBOS16]
MAFGSRPSPRSIAPTEPAASWEAPQAARARPDGAAPGLIKGSLTVSGALSFLRENGRRILTLALALFALGVIVLMILPVRYAATALVVLDPRELRITTEQDVLPGIGQDAAALQSQIEIAKSDGFLRPLIEQLKIADDDDIAGGHTDMTRLLEKFRSRLEITRRGLTYVIAISFTSNRPERAASYANAIAEAFVASQGRVRTAATDEAADWLKDRLKTLNERLRASEDAVAAFRLEHKILNAGKDSTTQQLRVTDLNQQVSAARLRTEEAKARYDQVQRDLKANVEGPVKQDLLSMLRAQRSALNDQIAQKKAVFGDRHPDLAISYSQLADINRQIEVERKKNIETAKSEYEAQLEQQKALEKQLKEVETKMLVDGQALVKLQELQRDADANRNIYEQFLSRFKTTDEQRQLQASQTKIASAAIPPLRSTRPPLALLLAALAIGSLLTSTAAVAVTTSMSDQSAPTEAPMQAAVAETQARQLQPQLQPQAPPQAQPPAAARPDAMPRLPVWARIPDLSSTTTASTVWQKPIASPGELDLGAHLRPLLERIDRVPVRGCKVALVLSVGKRAGGNTVARSLNRAAVTRGMMSVLIRLQGEFAGHQPPVTEWNDGSTTAGLQSIDELLSAGRKADARPEDDIRSEFDLIIVHAGNLALQPDAIALAAHADLIVLVARAGELGSAAMRRVTAALSRYEAVPTGLVVNHAPAGSQAPHPEGGALGLAV